MKLTIEPTAHFFTVGDVMVRMWRGMTDSDAPVIVMVAGVAGEGEAVELASGLVSIPPPTPEDARRWAEKVMARDGDVDDQA